MLNIQKKRIQATVRQDKVHGKQILICKWGWKYKHFVFSFYFIVKEVTVDLVKNIFHFTVLCKKTTFQGSVMEGDFVINFMKNY